MKRRGCATKKGVAGKSLGFRKPTNQQFAKPQPPPELQCGLAPPHEKVGKGQRTTPQKAGLLHRRNARARTRQSNSAVLEEALGDPNTYTFLQLIFYTFSGLCRTTRKRGIETLAGEDILAAIVQNFVFRACPQGQDGTTSTPVGGAGPAGGSSVFPAIPSTAPSSSQNRGTKRRKRGEGDEPPDRRKQPRLSRASSWACPFYLYDKGEYRDCLRYQLSRIVDVRQHIVRKHLQVSHCPTCGVTFPRDPQGTLRSNHIVQRTCQAPENAFNHPGATPDQWIEICESADGHAPRTDEQRWLVIWDILFPGSPHPLSPFVPYPEAVQIVLDYSKKFFEDGNGEALVDYFLPLSTDDRARRQLHENCVIIIRRFADYVRDQLASQVPSASRSITSRRSASELLQPPTPGLAGSGQATYANTASFEAQSPATQDPSAPLAAWTPVLTLPPAAPVLNLLPLAPTMRLPWTSLPSKQPSLYPQHPIAHPANSGGLPGLDLSAFPTDNLWIPYNGDEASSPQGNPFPPPD